MSRLKREFLFTGAFRGAWYPGFLAQHEAIAGKESGNIDILVRTLCLHLGIPHAAATMLERIVEAQTGIRAYLADNPGAYFRESFEQDDLAVSRHIVTTRDELMMGGWNGDPGNLPVRLGQAMEALGRCANPLNLKGLPDRVAAVIASLHGRGTRVFHAIYCARETSREPRLVQMLFEALASTGTDILPWTNDGATTGAVKSDLSLARQKAASGKQFSPKGDGSLLLLQGDTMYDSAEALACWLSREKPGKTVIIADEASRPMLDAALKRQHLPAIGSESSSPFRSALQVLQLVFALQWKPLDPVKLLEFLQLPLSPIPRSAGRELAKAVAAAPGIGNNRWMETVDRIMANSDDPDKLRARLNSWLPDEKTMLEPGIEMPAGRIRAVCRELSTWARARSMAIKKEEGYITREDELTVALLDAAYVQAELLARLVDASGLETLSALQLIRLLDKVSGEGMSLRVNTAEKGGLSSVSDPAAMLGTADTVIWWNFTHASGEYLPRRIFTDEERASLAGSGIIIPAPGDYALDLSREWKRPIENTAARLVLVAAETNMGEAQARHPLWDEISAGWKEADKNAITVHTRDLLKQPTEPLGVATAKVKQLAIPEPVPVFRLDNLQARLREKESASSLESLAGCPLKYILEYQARLYPAEALEVTSETVVRGNIGHRIIQEVFGPGKIVSSREEAQELAALAFERLVVSEGANLLLPGKEAEVISFKKSMVSAAGIFWQLLNDKGLSVTGVEEELNDKTEIGTVGGYIDLLLSDRKKNPHVLDMKYSEKGAKYYSERIKNDTAVQLAVYSRSAGKGIPVAYLSLKDAQLITTAQGGFPGATPAGNSSITDTWTKLVNTIGHVLKKQFNGKNAVATGVAAALEAMPGDADPPDGIRLEPPCGFCDYQCLCGYAWTANGGTA